MTSFGRFVIAAIMAPLSTPVVVTLAHILASDETRGLFVLVFLVACGASYLGFFILGLPAIYLLHKTGYLTFNVVILAGVVCGVIFNFAIDQILGYNASKEIVDLINSALYGAASGLLVATAFGLTAGLWGRRDMKRETDT